MEKRNSYFTKKPDMRQIWSLILLLAAVFLFFSFWFHPEYYTTGTREAGNLSFGKKKILLELCFLAGCIFLTFFPRGFFEKRKRLDRCLSILLAALTPFVTYLATHFMVRGMPINFSKKHNLSTAPEMVLMNVLIIAMLLLLFLMITNSLKAASVITLWIGIVCSLLNYFIYSFRDVPILASDLASITTAVDVAGNYDFTLNFGGLLTLEGGLGFLMAFRVLRQTKLFSRKPRLIFTAASLLALALFTKGFLLSDFLEQKNVTLNMFKPLISYNRYGTFLTFTRSFQYLQVEEPEGYQKGTVESLASAYPSDSSAAEEQLPNIIVIIDEAFSDLGVIGDLGTSEDYMPYFRSLKENTVRGYTYASILGGNTANTEFEFLTGNSILTLPENSIAFQLFVKHDMSGLASTCAQLGYQGLYAMHPHKAGNYSRPSVYPRLGFETFLSRDDFPEDADLLRNFISNRAVNEMIIEKYEEAKESSDQPFLFYTMTMQNHGNYDKAFSNLEETITLPAEHADESVQRYLNLIKHSDDALKELIAYYEKVEEPTVIVFFGDHQPKLSHDFLKSITNGAYSKWSTEAAMKQYAVPFLMWANFDIPEREYERTSMNYLQSILFDVCGLPMTGYQKYLMELQKEIPALTANGYWGADGKFYEPDDKSSPYYDKLLEYQLLLYNNIFDTSNRPDGFYSLNP